MIHTSRWANDDLGDFRANGVQRGVEGLDDAPGFFGIQYGTQGTISSRSCCASR